MSHFLDIQDLCVTYGNVQALRGITFHVDQGEIVTLIGSNGAGKTSTLMAEQFNQGKPSGRHLFQRTGYHPYQTQSDRESRRKPRAGGKTHFSQTDGGAEPDDGYLWRSQVRREGDCAQNGRSV